MRGEGEQACKQAGLSRLYGSRDPGAIEVLLKLLVALPTQLIPCMIALSVALPCAAVRRCACGPWLPKWTVRLEFIVLVCRVATWAARPTIPQLQWVARQFGGFLSQVPAGVTVEAVAVNDAGVTGEWVRPSAPPLLASVRRLHQQPAEGCLLYIHGGGFFMGTAATARRVICPLCINAGLPALSVDYRLAPQHP